MAFGLFDLDLGEEEVGVGEAGLDFGEEAEVFEEFVGEVSVAVLDGFDDDVDGVGGGGEEFDVGGFSCFVLVGVEGGTEERIAGHPAVEGGAVYAGGFGGGPEGLAGDEGGEGLVLAGQEALGDGFEGGGVRGGGEIHGVGLVRHASFLELILTVDNWQRKRGKGVLGLRWGADGWGGHGWGTNGWGEGIGN